MPQINAQIVSGHERLLIAIERDRIDVIGVRVGEYTLGYGLDLDAVEILDHRYADSARVAV